MCGLSGWVKRVWKRGESSTGEKNMASPKANL